MRMRMRMRSRPESKGPASSFKLQTGARKWRLICQADTETSLPCLFDATNMIAETARAERKHAPFAAPRRRGLGSGRA